MSQPEDPAQASVFRQAQAKYRGLIAGAKSQFPEGQSEDAGATAANPEQRRYKHQLRASLSGLAVGVLEAEYGAGGLARERIVSRALVFGGICRFFELEGFELGIVERGTAAVVLLQDTLVRPLESEEYKTTGLIPRTRRQYGRLVAQGVPRPPQGVVGEHAYSLDLIQHPLYISSNAAAALIVDAAAGESPYEQPAAISEMMVLYGSAAAQTRAGNLFQVRHPATGDAEFVGVPL